MMVESNTDLVRRGYVAFSSGDLEELSELIAQDTTWHVGGHNALSGTYRGRDAVLDYFGRLVEVTEGTLWLQLLSITEIAPGTVIACLHLAASAHGASFNEEVIQQIQIRDGQAVSCRTFLENGHLWDDVVGRATITLPSPAREPVA
jgi:ketosteroid isomerase-like protein